MSTAANLNVIQDMPQPDEFAVGIIHLDEALRITAANDICLPMLGLDQDVVSNRPFVWEALAEHAEFYWQVGSPTTFADFTGETFVNAIRNHSCGLKTRNGTVVEIFLTHGAGMASEPVLMARNITNIFNTNNLSSVSYERFRDFSEIASDWFWETDETLAFTMITNSVRKYNGDMDPSIYYGKRREYLPIADDETEEKAKWDAHFEDLENRRPFRNFEYSIIDQNGDSHYWSVSGAPFYHRNGDFGGYRGIGRDITDRRDLELELARRMEALERLKDEFEKLAMTDSLTGLANRRAFRARATDELHRVTRYGVSSSLLMLDLDLFKRINDTYGHEAGDQVLVEFVTRVSSFLRNTDLFSRLGGEEFAILLPMTEHEGMRTVAERLLQSLREKPLMWQGQEIWFTASAGGAAMQADDPTIDNVLARADKATYRAKNDGRDRYIQFAD